MVYSAVLQLNCFLQVKKKRFNVNEPKQLNYSTHTVKQKYSNNTVIEKQC